MCYTKSIKGLIITLGRMRSVEKMNIKKDKLLLAEFSERESVKAISELHRRNVGAISANLLKLLVMRI